MIEAERAANHLETTYAAAAGIMTEEGKRQYTDTRAQLKKAIES